MTKTEFIMAYNIGNRDGKAGDYCPDEYDDLQMIEPCKDAVSRSDVIDATGSWYDSGENNLYTIEEGYGVAERHLVDRIKKLPSQPVRQTGEWIKELERHFLDTRINDNVAMKEALGRGYHTYINDKCSCCNKIAIHDDTIYYEYCPHCGAKMEEG